MENQTNEIAGGQQDLAGGTGTGTDSAASAPKPAGKTEATVKVRVLVDCEHGKPNDVVSLAKSVATAAEKAGVVDTSKEAVAYAESIAAQE